MGKQTDIQWAHSSLNLQMGCDGCELWSAGRRICYAGIRIEEFSGTQNVPRRFEDPEIYPDRLEPALKWGLPTAKERDAKPWIPNDYPRLIFLNDMGDTFSKKLDLLWMAPMLPAMAASPHQFLLLTKRPSRAVEFSLVHPFPQNFWLGTSITSDKTEPRARQLRAVRGGGLRFVSLEPLWSPPTKEMFNGMQWAIIGGQSGNNPYSTYLEWIDEAVKMARAAGCRPFVKQLGTRPKFKASLEDPGDSTIDIDFHVTDSHGGRWEEWPEQLRVREMPELPKNARAEVQQKLF